MALKGAKSQLQQERTYGGVASSRIRPLTRLVGKFSKSKVSPKKKFARPSDRDDMSWSLPELARLYELTDRELERQVSDSHLEVISRSYCKQWKSLPPHLQLDRIVADDIDKSQKEDRVKRHEFLLQWKDIKGSHATYKQLLAALLKTKCRQDAESVCKMLKESLSLCAEPLVASATSTLANWSSKTASK